MTTLFEETCTPKDQDHIFSQIPFLAFAFHTFIIYVGESISLNCETRKRTTGGEQDFLRKGNWEDNKIHETRSGKTTGPEAYTQANVSVAMGLERRMVVEETMYEFQDSGKYSSSLISLKTSLTRFVYFFLPAY